MSDEHLRLIRALWTSEVVSFAGKYTHFTDMQASPRPVQQPHPPIWIGGNSRRAQRRVAELGDGWHATGAAPADIAAGRTYIQQRWSQHQRAGQPRLSLRIGLFIDGVSDWPCRIHHAAVSRCRGVCHRLSIPSGISGGRHRACRA